ncbi:MAG: hypothetical protein H7210_10545 [Pyrinomonadaceae bacterium]|nr:hypothetical protein [Phycisphaerales bacterium]
MLKSVLFAAAVLSGTLLSGHRAFAQGYTFTKVADSGLDDFDPVSTGAPSLSDTGYVAFSTSSAGKSVSRVLRSGKELARPLVTIGDDSINVEVGSFSDNVSVNNLGQVAVWATIRLPRLDERILRSSGGPLDTIAEAGDDSEFSFMSVIVSMNDAGTVAWQGEINLPNGPQGLFTGSGGPVTTIFSTASSMFTSSFAGPAINNAGQIAFRASTAGNGGDAVFRYDGGSKFTTIVNAGGPFSHAFDDEPSINSDGRVAVIGRSNDQSITYVIVGDGAEPAVPVVDTTGEFESINTAGINDSGQIAFSASLDDFTTQGIFTGPDVIKDRVISTGDALDGSTVSFLSMYREGLNNAGQIAFFAQLDDGRGVIMVASPANSCPADFNGDGTANSQDFFDYLAAFFKGTLAADFNSDTFVNSQDLFDFLVVFFVGC